MDNIERAQEAQIRDTEISLQEHQRFKIQKISTGYCEECGVEIPRARVEAIGATTCIECAIELEKEARLWR